MALFNSRGGQPFYLGYQATDMPAIAAPTGLATFIQLNAPKTTTSKSKKSTSSEEAKTEMYFPGTEGVIRQVNNFEDGFRSVENSYRSALTNKLDEYTRQGKDFNQFMEDEGVKKAVSQLQTIEYQKTQVSRMAPLANTDLSNINATEKIANDNNTGNMIAMRKVGGIYMPVQTKKNDFGFHMSSIDEYLEGEKVRDKIMMDENGVMKYDKSYLPPVVNNSGLWQKETDELGARAKVSTWGGTGKATYQSDPTSPLAQISYLTHQTGGSNLQGLRDAAKSLGDSMTDPALQGLDGDIHRDIEDGSARVYDVDEKGNNYVRYLNESEKENIKRVLTGDFEGMDEADINLAKQNYYNVIYDGRAIKINERLAPQKQTQSDVTISQKLYDATTGEGKMNTGEFFERVQFGNGDNQVANYSGTGEFLGYTTNRDPKTFGLVRVPGTQLMFPVNFAGKVFNGSHSQPVKYLNDVYKTQFANGTPVYATTLGGNVVNAVTGQPIDMGMLSQMQILGTNGFVAERIMLTQDASGKWVVPSISGNVVASNEEFAKLNNEATKVAAQVYQQTGNASMAQEARDNYLKNNMVQGVTNTMEYQLVMPSLKGTSYADLDSEELATNGIRVVEMGTGKEKHSVYVMDVAAELPENSFTWDKQFSYSAKQNIVTNRLATEPAE